jgi:hypothetical protein
MSVLGSVLLAAAIAVAAPGVRVAIEGELPFSSSELESAVSLRVESSAEGELIRVSSVGADGVRIVFRDRTRTISLLGQSGAPAARRVAIAIADLIEEVGIEIEGLEVDTSSVAAPTATVADRVPVLPREAPTREPEAPGLVLSLLASGGGGSELDRAELSLITSASARISGPWRAALSAGLSWSSSSAIRQGSVSILSFPLRAELAWWPGASVLELRGGAIVLPHRASGSVGEPHFDLVAGLGSSLHAHLAISNGLSFDGAIGLDVRLSQIEYQLGGTRATATDRAFFWAGAGLAYEVL